MPSECHRSAIDRHRVPLCDSDARFGAVQNASIAKANSAAVEALGSMRTVHANTGETRGASANPSARRPLAPSASQPPGRLLLLLRLRRLTRRLSGSSRSFSEARRFASHIRRFLRVVLVTVHTQTVVIFTQLLLSKMRDVLILGVGMHQVIAGELSIGAFTAFTQYADCFEHGCLPPPSTASHLLLPPPYRLPPSSTRPLRAAPPSTAPPCTSAAEHARRDERLHAGTLTSSSKASRRLPASGYSCARPSCPPDASCNSSSAGRA